MAQSTKAVIVWFEVVPTVHPVGGGPPEGKSILTAPVSVTKPPPTTVSPARHDAVAVMVSAMVLVRTVMPPNPP